MSRLPYTDEEMRAAQARREALRDESSQAHRIVKDLEDAGQFGSALAAAKTKHDELTKAFFAHGAKVREMEDAREAMQERKEAAAIKANKAASIAAWNRPYIEAVRQAGEQVDDAILNFVEAVDDFLQAQELAAAICADTFLAFKTANLKLMPVLYRTLAGLAGRQDNPMLDDATLATFAQHLPQED
jgi:hypothetical protein